MTVKLPARDVRWYGMRPDTPDQRDLYFDIEHPHLMMVAALPATVDLRETAFLPGLYDQGQLGSCVANAIGADFQYLDAKQGGKSYKPSRLALYYFARQIEGTVQSDAGCEIRDGIKVAAKLGAPHETLWPYKISRFTRQPTARVMADGAKHLALKYARVDNTGGDLQMASSIAGGLPVVIGISVYESFESQEVANTGVVPLPAPSEQMLGGHCMLAIGYRTATGGMREYLVRNSWGSAWGDGGHCWIPATYLINQDLASDFWSLSAIEA